MKESIQELMQDFVNDKKAIEKKGYFNLLLIGIFLIVAYVLLVHLSYNDNLRHILNLVSHGETGIGSLVLEFADSFFQLVNTMTSLVTASIIFFYTVMNNTQHGIPNRKLIAYRIGSAVVPALFCVVIFIGTPSLCFLYMLKYVREAYCVAILIYLLDCTLVFICILSSTRKFCVKTLIGAEKKQYQNFFVAYYYNQNTPFLLSESRRKMPIFYHIELLAENSELRAERLQTINKILCVPFLGLWNPKHPIISCKEEQSKAIYFFLHNNAGILIQKTFSSGDLENAEVDATYTMLYSYLEVLGACYNRMHNRIQESEVNGEKKEEESKASIILKRNYIAAWIAIMGAVAAYSNYNRESFCKHVLTKLIPEDLNTLKLNIYFAFLEYMFNSGEGNSLEDLISIIPYLVCKTEWNPNLPISAEDESLYLVYFWEIWFSDSNFIQEDIRSAYSRFSSSMHQEKFDSSIMSYIHYIQRRS